MQEVRNNPLLASSLMMAVREPCHSSFSRPQNARPEQLGESEAKGGEEGQNMGRGKAVTWIYSSTTEVTLSYKLTSAVVDKV